jgi:flagellar biosynthesis/type III secretory pathway chaperone
MRARWSSSAEEVQRIAPAAKVLLRFLEEQEKQRAVEREKVNVPGEGSEEIDLRERGIEEEPAERELEQDSGEDHGIREEVQPERVPR